MGHRERVVRTGPSDGNKGDTPMRFYQLMEFQSTAGEAVAELQRFKDLMGDQTTARRATVCVDRDDPGLIVQIVEFDSYEEAMANSDHKTTQDEAAKIEESTGGVTFRNLDVVEVVDI